ncbi:alpha/beta fold hydrolase [Rugamonas sp.]|uniref:alpha/beta fold hydrolase n=1 Tax=Rugamonas sp. TaxID=1926287 RepID=UPI0025FBB6C2|nr:alpha/beta hydrolase [Rugamonas sp.]
MSHANTFQEHHIAREQGSIYVRDYPGTGPAFVLMHGFPDNLHIYDYLVPHLTATGRRVVAFDFLGFGKSDKLPGAAYSFAQQVGDLHAVVQTLELGRIVPVGHDSSGAAAVNYAIDYPQHVASVVLLNSVYDAAPTIRYPELIELFATPSLKALTQAMLRSPEQFGFVLNFQRAQFQAELQAEHKALYAEFLGPLIDNNFRQQPSSAPAFAQMTAQLFAEADRNSARLHKMAQLTVPVQLIWGETDPYLNVGVARHLKSHLKHGELHELAAGHWVQIDVAEQVAQLMLSAKVER